MTTIQIRALIFFGVIAMCCALAWLAGYNFDHRSVNVAFTAICILCFAAFMAICPYIKGKEKS